MSGDGDLRPFPDYTCIEAARSWFRKLVQMRNSRQGECSARPAVNWRMRNTWGQERWFFGSWHAVWRVRCDPPRFFGQLIFVFLRDLHSTSSSSIPPFSTDRSPLVAQVSSPPEIGPPLPCPRSLAISGSDIAAFSKPLA